ncbi:hypothetical protein ACFLRR_01935 [Bacteroidota bacterium]
MISTTGITIDKHYHIDQLFSISLFGEAKSCCDGPCDCCHNEKEVIKISDNFVSSSNVFSIDIFPQIISLVSVENLLREEYQTYINNICFQNRPPPAVQKKSVVLQTFLI